MTGSVINNPYLEEFFAAREHPDAYQWDFQHGFTHKYSWSVPTAAALEAIRDFSPDGVCEIGAGTGYWASILRDMHVDVVAYDANPVEEQRNIHHRHAKSFTVIERGDASAATQHPERTLMLCWPPHGMEPKGSAMSHEALSHFAGDRLVYIGQARGGLTGTEEFHRQLRRDWRRVKWMRLPHFKHIYNALYLYQRKT
jgi:hypothetical protein